MWQDLSPLLGSVGDMEMDIYLWENLHQTIRRKTIKAKSEWLTSKKRLMRGGGMAKFGLLFIRLEHGGNRSFFKSFDKWWSSRQDEDRLIFIDERCAGAAK